MKIYAQVSESNLVTNLVVVDKGSDAKNKNWLDSRFGGTWVKTSNHEESPKPGTVAGKGYTYDSGSKKFIAPQPFDSWTLNKSSWIWEPPTSEPDDGKPYRWDEESLTWVEVELETE